jgi:hypothetical protein
VNYEGRLHFMRIGKQAPEYGTGFTPYAGVSGGAIKVRPFAGEQALREFLVGPIGADQERVEVALKELREKGASGLDRIVLSDEQLREFGLK